MVNTKSAISDHIADHPGVHFNALVREMDLASGQVQYHLKGLIRRGEIIDDHRYGRTHYFPDEYDEWERGVIALARRETARDVLICLLEREEAPPKVIADEIDIARSTLEWHLERLVESDIVLKRRDGQNRVTLKLRDRVEVAELLQDVTPSMPERMVDRFTRLVDQFLSK